jgi:hypothetical protein
MAYNHDDVIRAQAEQLAAARADALGLYEAARIREDADGVMDAANRIIETDARLAALGQIANQFVASQQRPQGNKYGLSRDQIEIAEGIASNDRTLSADDRQRIYAQNRNRLQHMRATGQYRDDQGRR